MKIITCRQSFLRRSMVFVLELLRKLLCMNLCAVWSIALFEKRHFRVFSWILSAPSTMSPSVALLRLCEGWAWSKIFTSWIETLLRHRTVQVELCGDKVKREVVKRNPQGGILSSFLWNCVLNNLLLELRSRGFYVQAYADDLAVLVTGADMLWIRGMAQKAVNIAENCALEQELQFSCKKTEIVLFTHKRSLDLGSLSMNGTKLELSKEARLLGVTLDSKLTWKPHITRITRKATTALMQCRQIVGKTWGITPSMMKWIYTAVICQPCRVHVCSGLAVSTKSI